jgi:LPXTG-motif cell wall-anchored protein
MTQVYSPHQKSGITEVSVAAIVAIVLILVAGVFFVRRRKKSRALKTTLAEPVGSNASDSSALDA